MLLRYLRAELPRVLVRLAIALIAYDLLLRVPWPGGLAPQIAQAAVGLLTATLLMICGKFLYDTLFFDRYWRQVDSR